MRKKKKTLYQKYLDKEIDWELSQDEIRKIYKEYYAEYDRVYELKQHSKYQDKVVVVGYRVKVVPGLKPPESPTYPEIIRDLTCGAKTRKGTPCKRTDLYSSGRCKFHGGMSTGPTTPEGKKKIAQNAKKH
jgi:hypothetical protein